MYAPSAVVYHKLKATGGSVTGSYYDGRNFLFLLWKNYPTSLLWRYWPVILRAQLRITWEALRAWKGAAARARLRGSLAALSWALWEARPHHLVRSSRRARAYLGEYDRGPDPLRVDWLIGANGAYRREVFETCGPFRADTDRVEILDLVQHSLDLGQLDLDLRARNTLLNVFEGCTEIAIFVDAVDDGDGDGSIELAHAGKAKLP